MPLDTVSQGFAIATEAVSQAAEVDSLVDRMFGPGRFVKTAERLREDSKPLEDLSFVATDEGRVIGSVRLWPIFVWDEIDNTYEPLAFLGPIAVEPSFRGQGIGKRLVHSALSAAFEKGLRAVLLVGSQTYFAPFGFEIAEKLTLPGPVDPRRVLVRYREVGPRLSGKVVKVV